MRTIHTFLIILLFKVLAIFGQAPTNQVGNWLMFFNQSRLTEKWSLHTEVQHRSFKLLPNIEQLLLRGGVNYHINNTSFVTFGYGFINNYDFDKELNPSVQVSENRIWQQFIMRNKLGRIAFEHRYRLEQRWLESKTSEKYLDRIRYLLRVSVPINKKEIEKGTIFLSFYDEVFIHLTTTPFDRNRLFGSIGYQFSPNANIQIGYVAQTVNITTKHYFQTAINFNLDFRRTESP